MKTADVFLREGEAALRPSPDAMADARLLLAFALGKEPSFPVSVTQVTQEQAAQFAALLERRRAGEPTQYILGEAYFMGYRFYVDQNVLIPRQDTETLAEAALEDLANRQGSVKVLDLCTGSGALAVSLKLRGEEPRTDEEDGTITIAMTATDLSLQALQVARRNAEALGALVETAQGDLFAAVGDARFDLIVCNPPYLSKTDMRLLQPEVRLEPEMALYGGEDGLDLYRRLARESRAHLRRGGLLLMEVGASQAEDVVALFEDGDEYDELFIVNDLNGIQRVVGARVDG